MACVDVQSVVHKTTRRDDLAHVNDPDYRKAMVLMNNHGYSMIQQTQDQWLNSRYEASTVKGGLAFPEFQAIAQAYGFKTVTLRTNQEAEEQIRGILAAPGAAFINVEIRPEERVVPQVKFGRPIEDSEPLLERAEFFENMIVEPADASKI